MYTRRISQGYPIRTYAPHAALSARLIVRRTLPAPSAPGTLQRHGLREGIGEHSGLPLEYARHIRDRYTDRHGRGVYTDTVSGRGVWIRAYLRGAGYGCRELCQTLTRFGTAAQPDTTLPVRHGGRPYAHGVSLRERGVYKARDTALPVRYLHAV